MLKQHAALDTNKDGDVTKEEIAAHFKKRFEQKQPQKSGKDGAKLQARGDRKIGDRKIGDGKNADGKIGDRKRGDRVEFRSRFGNRGPDGRRPMGPPSAAVMLERFDKNKDSKLQKDELPEFIWTRLSKSDADKDGSVSQAELEQHLKSLPARGPMDAKGRRGPGERTDEKSKAAPEAPKSKAPKVDSPKTDSPKTETLKPEAPKSETSASEKPKETSENSAQTEATASDSVTAASPSGADESAPVLSN